MYEDDVSPSWFFFWSDPFNLVFSDKKIQIPKILPVGFCSPEMLIKFWDFGMDFDN